MKHPPLLVAMDLEGVLVPEIWINVAEATGVAELRLTTGDVADYDELMQGRLEAMRKHNILLPDIQQVIGQMSPFPGAVEFLEELRSQFQVVIISDTFYEFATPLMRSLGWPALFCNTLVTDENDMVTGYNLRQQDGKRKAVTALSDLNFKVVAVGDSYNDTTMLQQADLGILFHAGEKVKRDFPSLPTCDDYNDLLTRIRDFEQQRQQEHCRR